jgi:hypothetical protein
MKNFWFKNKMLVYPITFLVVLLPITFFLLTKYLDYDGKFEQALTITVSVLGLIFAIFQVWLNIAIQGIRNKASLRHTEYKELVRLMNSISEVVNDAMVMNVNNIEAVVNVLMNKQEVFASFINNNDNYLFNDIRYNTYLNEANRELLKMISVTDKFRAETQNVKMNDNLMNIIHQVSWDSAIGESLTSFNKTKHQALRDMHKYLR